MESATIRCNGAHGGLAAVAVTVFSLAALVPSGALAHCIISDLPDCTCDNTGGAWPVTSAPGNLLNVARETSGTIITTTKTSCARHRGQPYWQVQQRRRTQSDAHLVAHFFPDYVEDFPAEPWCTEAIAYWHLEAELPYSIGYSTVTNPGARNHHPSPRVRSTEELRLWYKEEERLRVEDGLATRGRWIDGGELDYDNFEPGVNGPCPGAYQQQEGQVFFGDLPDWAGPGVAHSQVVDSMIVYRLAGAGGAVQRVDVRVIEGNVGLDSIPDTLGVDFLRSRVKNTKWYQDVIDYTVLGDSLTSGRKIRGWGVDLGATGGPLYDASRIRTVVTNLILGYPAPEPPDTSDSAIINQFRVYHSQTQGSVTASTNSSGVQTGGTIAHPGNHWLIAAGPHPVDPVYIDIDLLANHPFRVRGVEIDWKDGKFPDQFQVWWAAQNGPIFTKTVTKATGALPPPTGLDFAVPVAFAPDSGYVVRHARLCFANTMLTEPFEITAFHYIFHVGAAEDSNGSAPDEPDTPPPVGVPAAGEIGRGTIRLFPNAPNPFGSFTALTYVLPRGSGATLAIFDAQGRRVRSFDDLVADEQVRFTLWDGRDASGRESPSGVYFYELRTGRERIQRKMILTR